MATQIKTIRESLGETQESLARRCDLLLSTYRRAEGGSSISYTTATAVLRGVNEALAEQGRPPMALDDLGLKIV